MSRCFPYPPPGYARKVARTEAALIESIKLHSERREHRADRKKEKSKDKKHKSKEHKEKSSRKVSDHKRKKGLKEAKDLTKVTKVEAEQLEKSGLTEEHGQPVWPHSPGYLSDGTQTTHKRKRDATSQPNEGSKLGKIIRIKLSSSSSQKEDSLASREQKCSTSGRDQFLDQKKVENSRVLPIHPRTYLSSVDTDVVKDPTSSKLKFCFTTNADTAVAVKDPTFSKLKSEDPSRAINNCSQVNVPLPPRTRRPAESAHKDLLDKLALPPLTRSPAESAYDALFNKWAPPLLQLEQQTDEEEWLFGTRKQAGQTTIKPCSPTPSCRSSSMWPRGQYLPDADVYSLPYTIPF